RGFTPPPVHAGGLRNGRPGFQSRIKSRMKTQIPPRPHTKPMQNQLHLPESAPPAPDPNGNHPDPRREEYRRRLAEKLKDPAFRQIEGFPIGTDEAILALSD